VAILGPVRRPRDPRWLIAALCLALVVLRIGGVHLHLCFDGSEPPISYHVADSGIHHLDEHEAGETHSDRDMALGEDVLLKKPAKAQDSLLFLFAFALLLFLLSRSTGPRPKPGAPPPLRPDLSWLRPPLRGPPTPA
jgi:hypothetical protein